MRAAWPTIAIFVLGSAGVAFLVVSAMLWLVAEVAAPVAHQRWQSRIAALVAALEQGPWRRRRLPILVVDATLGVIGLLGAGVSVIVRRDVAYAVLVGPILSGVAVGIVYGAWWGVLLGIVFLVVGFLAWSGAEGISSAGHTSASPVELLCLLVYPLISLFPLYQWLQLSTQLANGWAALVTMVVLPFYAFPLAVLLAPIDEDGLLAFGLALSFPLTFGAAWLGGNAPVSVRFLLVMAAAHVLVAILTLGGLSVAAKSLPLLLAAGTVVVVVDAAVATLVVRYGLGTAWTDAFAVATLRQPPQLAPYARAVQTVFLAPALLVIVVLFAGLLRTTIALVQEFAILIGRPHVKPAGALAAATAIIGAVLSGVAYLLSTYPTR